MDRSMFPILIGWVLVGAAIFFGPPIWDYAVSPADPCTDVSKELSDARAEPVRVTIAQQTMVIPLENTTIPRNQDSKGASSVTPFQRCKYVEAASKEGFFKAGFRLPGARRTLSPSPAETQYYSGDRSFIELTIYPLSLEKNSTFRKKSANDFEQLSRRYIEKNGERFVVSGGNPVSKVDLYHENYKEYQFYIECPSDFPGMLCDGWMVDGNLNLYTRIEFAAFQQKLDAAFFISQVRNALGSWSVGDGH